MVAGAAVGLGLVGVVSLGYAFASQQGPPPAAPAAAADHMAAHGGAVLPSAGASAPAGSPAGAGRATGEAYDTAKGPQLDASDPVRVRIPAIDVSTDVIDLGLQKDRRMEVPQNGRDVGWYTGAPTPGELGPAVLAAHVTWSKKPAVFFDLGGMKRGQRIEVDRTDGSTAVFEVTKIGQYPKADFPTEEVYGSVDHAALRVITCGGVLDGETGHHVDNVVVFAKLVDSKA